ncbi:MAG: hypothetical protein FKGGLIKP_00279 [Sodalis sp. Fse]|nr:MAG: hypothetical protein FKGGLIKP_00279 [Sodalis sp. Fse]
MPFSFTVFYYQSVVYCIKLVTLLLYVKSVKIMYSLNKYSKKINSFLKLLNKYERKVEKSSPIYQ